MGYFKENPKPPITLLYNYFLLITINNINKYMATVLKQGMSKITVPISFLWDVCMFSLRKEDEYIQISIVHRMLRKYR